MLSAVGRAGYACEGWAVGDGTREPRRAVCEGCAVGDGTRKRPEGTLPRRAGDGTRKRPEGPRRAVCVAVTEGTTGASCGCSMHV